MPNSPRTSMRLDMKKSIDHLEKVAEYTLRVRAMYDPNYPDYVTVIDYMLEILADVLDAYKKFLEMV